MKLKFADAEDKLNTLTLVPENAVGLDQRGRYVLVVEADDGHE